MTEVAWGLRFTVLVQPRASRTELSGAHGGALRLRVQAPPVDGAANDAVIAFLAETLGIRRRDVRIVAGETSRSKIVDVAGVTRAEVEQLGMIIGRR
ncbi:MAG: DUF167 domain-containing protein [Gemmatimonadaceae bacterium]|nr:DUF167 domain-containing protein [Gemmatimonadaceae bacterium]